MLSSWTDADAAIRSGLSLLSSCVEEEEGVVKVAGGVPVQHTQAPLLDQEELEEVMKRGAVHLKLAHYRNKLLHLFVPEAMLMMALQEQEETLAGLLTASMINRTTVEPLITVTPQQRPSAI